ncbi:MAG: excisionase family DNA-binding protein [Actinomycetota bacterium]
MVREHLAGHVEPRLLSVQAAARALGISEAACWQLVDQGNGPLRSLKVGRRRLIPRQWLDEYVAELVTEAS